MSATSLKPTSGDTTISSPEETLATLLAFVETRPAPRWATDEPIDEPDEPDFDEEYEADRAADRYERWLDSLG